MNKNTILIAGSVLVILVSLGSMLIRFGGGGGRPPADLVGYDERIGEALGQAAAEAVGDGAVVQFLYLEAGAGRMHPGAERQIKAAKTKLEGVEVPDPLPVSARISPLTGEPPDPERYRVGIDTSMGIDTGVLSKILLQLPEGSVVVSLGGLLPLDQSLLETLKARSLSLFAFDMLDQWTIRRAEVLRMVDQGIYRGVILRKANMQKESIHDPAKLTLENRYEFIR